MKRAPRDRHGMPVDRRGFLKGAAAGAALFADSGASPSAEAAPLPLPPAPRVPAVLPPTEAQLSAETQA